MLILVVDDIEKNRKLLSRYLDKQGWDVLLAKSGQEAVDLVKEHDIDVILMDIKMPDMDGYEAARQIKAMSSDNYLPIIYVSALSEDEALEQALEAGGDDYVTKPVSFGLLKSKINAHYRIRELSAKINLQNKQLNEHNLRLQREHRLISHFFDQAREHCYFDENVIKTYSKSVERFNGDTVLTGRRPNGGVSMMVGDFTGHGLSAAVGTLPVSQIFFSMLEDNAYIGDIAKELNRQIGILLPVEMFFAVSLIELSAKGDRLMVWHGGMPDAYLYDQASEELKVIHSQHLPLGIRSQEEFNDSVQLFYVNESCKFVAMTDGLLEAVNIDNEMIKAEVYEKEIVNSDNVLESIINCYEHYSDGVAQSDDVSVLELSCLEVGRQSEEESDIAYTKSASWEVQFIIEDEVLQRDATQNIMDMIGGAHSLKDYKGVVHTLLMEMYTNALDHGVLGLDGSEKTSSEAFDLYYKERERLLSSVKGARINIKIAYEQLDAAGNLLIEMSHNGNEFNVSEFNASADALHGRGMALIGAICKDVTYSDNGRCLTVTMEI